MKKIIFKFCSIRSKTKEIYDLFWFLFHVDRVLCKPMHAICSPSKQIVRLLFHFHQRLISKEALNRCPLCKFNLCGLCGFARTIMQNNTVEDWKRHRSNYVIYLKASPAYRIKIHFVKELKMDWVTKFHLHVG